MQCLVVNEDEWSVARDGSANLAVQVLSGGRVVARSRLVDDRVDCRIGIAGGVDRTARLYHLARLEQFRILRQP